MGSPWKPVDSSRKSSAPQAKSNSSDDKYVRKKAAEKAEEADPIELRETFISRKPLRKLDDLILPEDTRKQIEVLLTKLQYQDTLYHEWNLIEIDPYGERTALNLYGPPGTGKTFCAEAIAHHLGKNILDVNYAELESKYVGETSKNIVMAFEAARDDEAVLFFDEADSILGKRLTDVRQSADYGVNQSRSVMLKQLEDFQGVVIFATNMAKNYDGAFVRRILGHIEFRLPDEKCRHRLWEQFLVPQLPLNDDVSVEKLAQISDGLSGGEMQNVLVTTASSAVGREGAERCLVMEDFEHQMAVMKRARRDIGNYDYGSSDEEDATERRVKIEDLPPSVRRTVEGGESTKPAPYENEVRWARMPREFLPMGLRILNEVARADDVVEASEREALGAILTFCSPQEAESLWDKSEGDDVLQGLEEMRGTPWGKLVLRDAVAVGFSDGEFTEEERVLVQGFASRLGLDDNFIKGCESWAVRGLHWMQKGADILEEA
jgi:AAA+ superfamily predicted ATPase/tellurite resistance protein